MKLIFIVAALIFSISCKEVPNQAIDTPIETEKPTVSFTFDDGLTKDIAGYKFEEWNAMILTALTEADLEAMFFVTGFNKLDVKGKYLLNEWDKRNHKIANHTLSHPNFNDKNNTLAEFEDELLMTDTIIGHYSNHVKYFRFPYLKEGKTKEKVNGIRSILHEHNYQNGYVTIDASDWYVNSRLINQLNYRKKVDTMAFQEFYINHIIDRAKFYESISYQLHGRHIKHTLLLHHNLTSALFLDCLIKKFKSEGWDTIDANEAYNDPIYQCVPAAQFAGESLIWSLAKQSGTFNDQLRYPAEDSRYEKDEMDRLRL